MNFGHLVTLPGILKIVALVTCLLATSIGSAAFFTSSYNKSCRDGTFENFGSPSFEQTTATSSDTTTLRTRSTALPKSPIVSMGSTLNPNAFPSPPTSTEPSGEYKDMAPVLWMEKFQFSATGMSFVISVVLLIMYTCSENLEYSKVFKAVNFTFHFIFCVILITSAIFIAFAAVEIDRQICEKGNFDKREDCQKYIQKMTAATFTLLTSVLYGVICVKLVATKLYEEV